MVVFGSFMGESDRVVKLLLVPATMERLGDRILPRVHIEAPADLDAELAELEEVERGQQESVSE
jgi:hypothetical protein